MNRLKSIVRIYTVRGKGLEVTSKWENRDRKLGKKRDLKEMNAAHRVVDTDEEAKRERES